LSGFSYASPSGAPEYVPRADEKAYRASRAASGIASDTASGVGSSAGADSASDSGSDASVYGLSRLAVFARLPGSAEDQPFFEVFRGLYPAAG
jgi:hypothetical protein